MHRAGAFQLIIPSREILQSTLTQPGSGLLQTLTQQARTHCGNRVGARNSGAGSRQGPPSGRSRPLLPGAPPRTQMGEGCWRCPAAQTPQRSLGLHRLPRSSLGLPGGFSSAVRNHRLWPGLFQRESKMRSCAS